MIWSIIILASLAVGIVFTVIGSKRDIDPFLYIGISMIIMFSIATAISLCAIIPERFNNEANLLEWQAKHDAIEYQLENGIDMADSLVEYNSKVTYSQKMHESPWTNWYFGDYWTELEPIDVSGK